MKKFFNVLNVFIIILLIIGASWFIFNSISVSSYNEPIIVNNAESTLVDNNVVPAIVLPIDEAMNNMVEIDGINVEPDSNENGVVNVGARITDDGLVENSGNPVNVSCNSLGANEIFIPNVNIFSEIDNSGKLGTFDETGLFVLPETAFTSTQWVDGASATSDSGVTLIAAHRGYGGYRGVFNDLVNVSEGDVACVTDSEGKMQKYQIEKTEVYLKDDLPQSIFVDALDGDKKLVLITCGGDLNRTSTGSYSYDKNVIVTFKAIN